ncbi:MAG TPA: hypothetical protein VLV76_25135, partial [Candidatus Acidoferrum sp.]|nr:hypothetical protein [Candidatus Acidoferrum sp.]
MSLLLGSPLKGAIWRKMRRFVFTKASVHGASNPIVSRLVLQVLSILDECNLPGPKRQKLKDLYFDTLMKKLLRCWEIRERYGQ